jgi:hypothetical protein
VVWPEGVFRGFEDWRLKMTAANVRVYTQGKPVVLGTKST